MAFNLNKRPRTIINSDENSEDSSVFYYKQLVLDSSLSNNYNQNLINNENEIELLPFQFILNQPVNVDYYRVKSATVPITFDTFTDNFYISVRFVVQVNGIFNALSIKFPLSILLINNAQTLVQAINTSDWFTYEPGLEIFTAQIQFYPDFNENTYVFGNPVTQLSTVFNLPLNSPNLPIINARNVVLNTSTGFFNLIIDFVALSLLAPQAIVENYDGGTTPLQFQQNLQITYIEFIIDSDNSSDVDTFVNMTNLKPTNNVITNDINGDIPPSYTPINAIYQQTMFWQTLPDPNNDGNTGYLFAISNQTTGYLTVPAFNSINLKSDALSSGQSFIGSSQIDSFSPSLYGSTNIIATINTSNIDIGRSAIYTRNDSVDPKSMLKSNAKQLSTVDFYLTLPVNDYVLNFNAFPVTIVIEILSRRPFS